jgi:NTE family protein
LRARDGLGLALLVVAVTACAHYPVNAPLTRYDEHAGYRFGAPPAGANTDSLFVCLTFSGGGTRAASLAYGVLERLRDAPVVWDGATKRLLDEVDCISSVSGGSFPAAYYGLFGDRVFRDFRPNFLARNIEEELTQGLFNPANLARLASPTFARSDMAAALYDQTVFERKTFADLTNRRPFVILNATNIATGDRFEFTQDQFDFLGSDLSQTPVARAVATSSAFPILLTPLAFDNHPSPPGFTLPQTYLNAMKDFSVDRRRYQWAHSRMMYLDKEQRPYVHLSDGGMADNIGLRPIEAAYREASGFIRQRINRGEIRRLVIIAVNARTDPQEHLSQSNHTPGIVTVGLKAATIAMDNYSFETVEMMKESEEARQQAQRDVAGCQAILDKRCPGGPRLPALHPLRTCFVEVNFEAIADAKTRTRFLEMPTTFNLPPESVQALIDMGKSLLDADPSFQRLLRALSPQGGTREDEGKNCS